MANTEKKKEYNREYSRKHGKVYYDNNRETILAQKREAYAKDPEAKKVYTRKRNLMVKYGITEDEWEQLWSFQEGNCDICGRPMDKDGRRSMSVCVDHNHDTENVRGLIHRRCNTLLGMAEDDIEILEKAIAYLRRHQ